MSRRKIVFPIFLLAAGIGLHAEDRTHVVGLVKQIQAADYKDDRDGLKRLHDELGPFVEQSRFGAHVQYWRGFALWRRAINGFNDRVAPSELQADLQRAIDEFQSAWKMDPKFADAKIGELSCYGFLMFSNNSHPDAASLQEMIGEIHRMRHEVEAVDAGNPRLAWVMGPMVWNAPPEHGGGPERAIEDYEKALTAVRKSRGTDDPLDPSWGEPELRMSLAWSYLHRPMPDLDRAEIDAEAALKLVPYWHYVREILLPQIQEARRKAEAAFDEELAPRFF